MSPPLSHIPARGPLALAVLASALLAGCESTGLGPLDTTGRPPVVANPSVSPSAANIDSLPSPGGEAEIEIDVGVTAGDPDGSATLRTVRAELFRPGASSPFLTAELRDDGRTPDAAAGDGVFASRIRFTARREQAGFYRIRFTSVDAGGLRSTGLERTLRLVRNNAPPRLLDSTFQAPDTLLRPPTGTALFFLSIAATDEDGLGDITQVFLQNLVSLNRSFLLDDGGAPQAGGITSGDLLAGDGIFSVTLQLPSTTPPGSYPFRLQAVDTFGDTSASLPYTLVVQ